MTAFWLGFLGSLHCLGMCSGLVLAARRRHWRYQLGRLLGYLGLGLVGGTLGMAAPSRLLQGLAGLVMIGSGLALAGWVRTWHGSLLPRGWLLGRLAPALGSGSPLALGLVTALLPCGLLYAGVAEAAAASSPLGGAFRMACFWLGTLPALWAVAWLGPRRVGTRWAVLAGLACVALGLATLGAAALGHGCPSCSCECE